MIIGYLGRDAEIKEANGTQFATFTIADTVTTKNANGVSVERTTWFECSMKNNNVVPYLKKGQLVVVIGRAYATAFTRKDTGIPAATMKMQVHEINLLGSKPSQSASQQQQQTEKAAPTMPDDENDGLPF